MVTRILLYPGDGWLITAFECNGCSEVLEWGQTVIETVNKVLEWGQTVIETVIVQYDSLK